MPHGSGRAYVELLRPANIVTAIADVLAGYAIVGSAPAAALPWLLISTACLYGGGVVLNDFFDRDLDAIERPERPIPSGRVHPGAAASLGAGLLAAGTVAALVANLAAAGVAMGIAALVLAYDSWAKRHSVVGPLTMGACRGVNLCLGMAAAPALIASRWGWAVLPFSYIVAVTSVSRGEVHGGSRTRSALSLIVVTLVVVALMGAAVWASAGGTHPAPVVLACVLAWRVLPPFWHAWRRPVPGAIRHAVKAGVLSLIFLDAALAAVFAGTAYGIGVLALALLAYGLSRLFAVT